MLLKLSFIFVFFFSLIGFSTILFAQENTPLQRNRMEELFLWKVSEDLKLSVSEEKALADFVKDYSLRRNKANDAVQLSLKKISDTAESKVTDKTLSDYKKQIKKYNDLALEEIDQMKKILGLPKAAKYFVIKNDLSNRIKSLLALPEKSQDDSKPDIGKPKIIIE